jgi:hypothetical protein
MHTLNKAHLLKKLESVFKEAKPPTQYKPDMTSRLFVANGVSFMLIGEGRTAFNEAVGEVLDNKLAAGNFSKQYIHNALRDLVSSNLRRGRLCESARTEACDSKCDCPN